MKQLIIEVPDDFRVKDMNEMLEEWFGLEVKEVRQMEFKGKKCPICKKMVEDLLQHIAIDHTQKERDEYSKKESEKE